jgi:hypothetical protein
LQYENTNDPPHPQRAPVENRPNPTLERDADKKVPENSDESVSGTS